MPLNEEKCCGNCGWSKPFVDQPKYEPEKVKCNYVVPKIALKFLPTWLVFRLTPPIHGNILLSITKGDICWEPKLNTANCGSSTRKVLK